MKKFVIIIFIFLLIFSTAIIKNSTKKIEDEIFVVKESLRDLENKLDDKIVKYFFKSLSENKSISRYQPKLTQLDPIFFMKHRKPIIPTKKELYENVSSRSAKLRFVIKKRNFYNFDTDIFEKFKSLIEIENIGNKL